MVWQSRLHKIQFREVFQIVILMNNNCPYKFYEISYLILILGWAEKKHHQFLSLAHIFSLCIAESFLHSLLLDGFQWHVLFWLVPSFESLHWFVKGKFPIACIILYISISENCKKVQFFIVEYIQLCLFVFHFRCQKYAKFMKSK